MGLLNILNYSKETKILINSLDIAGNTLSAIVKGYATGSGGLVSFGLYGAIMLSLNVHIINLNEIKNLVFLILGCLFTYLIIALCMKMKFCHNSNKILKPDYYEMIRMSTDYSFKSMTVICTLVLK